jgi:hypothetical protein
MPHFSLCWRVLGKEGGGDAKHSRSSFFWMREWKQIVGSKKDMLQAPDLEQQMFLFIMSWQYFNNGSKEQKWLLFAPSRDPLPEQISRSFAAHSPQQTTALLIRDATRQAFKLLYFNLSLRHTLADGARKKLFGEGATPMFMF